MTGDLTTNKDDHHKDTSGEDLVDGHLNIVPLDNKQMDLYVKTVNVEAF